MLAEEEAMKHALAVLSVAAMLASSSALLAHEGHAHKVMGTVIAMDAAHIEVEATDGTKHSFPLAKETKYLKTTTVAPAETPQTATAAEVKVGMRVVLSVVEKNGKKTVTEVRLGAAGKPESPGHKH
jgi:hypothetical protein